MSKLNAVEQEAYLKRLIEYGDRIKTEQSLVNDVLREHLCRIPNKKLYKFRTCSVQNFKTLEENCIWMPPASAFQDTFDCAINVDFEANAPELELWMKNNYLIFYLKFLKDFSKRIGIEIDYPKDVIQQYIKTCVNDCGEIDEVAEYEFLKQFATPEELTRFDSIISNMHMVRKQFEARLSAEQHVILKPVAESIDSIRSYLRDSTLVYCMTDHVDNNRLWETYSANYSGFCVEYNFEDYTHADFDIYKNLLYLMPMQYVIQKPFFDIVPFIDIAMKDSLEGEGTILQNPELVAKLNMQMYYKEIEYDSEHEWRFSIRNKSNNKQPFPFVSAIYVGKDIKPRNLSRLRNIAKKLGVPIYRQTINRFKNGYDYKLCY